MKLMYASLKIRKAAKLMGITDPEAEYNPIFLANEPDDVIARVTLRGNTIEITNRLADYASQFTWEEL